MFLGSRVLFEFHKTNMRASPVVKHRSMPADKWWNVWRNNDYEVFHQFGSSFGAKWAYSKLGGSLSIVTLSGSQKWDDTWTSPNRKLWELNLLGIPPPTNPRVGSWIQRVDVKFLSLYITLASRIGDENKRMWQLRGQKRTMLSTSWRPKLLLTVLNYYLLHVILILALACCIAPILQEKLRPGETKCLAHLRIRSLADP